MHTDRFRPSPTVRASISADGLVLLDIDGGQVLASNAVGARIWQMVEAGRTPLEIAGCLVHDYDVTPDRALGDVVSLVGALESRGLIAKAQS